MNAPDALLAASALHLGFQLVVTGVVYPALSEVPSEDWVRAHDAHSRRVTVVVAPVYGLLAAACLWVLVSGPHDVLLLTSVVGAVVSALATAFGAAPIHGKIGRDGPSTALIRRLLRADVIRLGGSLLCFGSALAAAI